MSSDAGVSSDAGMSSDAGADAGFEDGGTASGDAGLEEPNLEGVRPLPVSIALPRPSGPGWVEVEVLQAGVQVTRAVRRMDDFSRHASIEMVLTLDCLPVDCPAGQTCVSGRCELAPGPRDEPSCVGQPESRDAGADAGDASVARDGDITDGATDGDGGDDAGDAGDR